MTAFRKNRSPWLLCGLLLMQVALCAQVKYPYPVHKIRIAVQDTMAEMAYMDEQPAALNGKTVLLLHGKNFNGFYWKNVSEFLLQQGYRVVIPDQLGWGQSDKPVLQYSFHLLAANTATLLDSLHTGKVIVVAHSMGGMLAARMAMLFPEKIEKMVLENPIGLEDYKRFVPYTSIAMQAAKERQATYASYKKYQQSYYPQWKPEYEQYVAAQAAQLNDPAFLSIALVNALTYDMIYQQPVCYEWDRLSMPVLLLIGQEDRTVVGKDLLTASQKIQYGQYPILGKSTVARISNAMLIELPGVGHIPHIQVPDAFQGHLLDFIQ